MLSAIVVNFRSHELVNDCLRSLLSGSVLPDEIVVVDNDGGDGGLAPELVSDERVHLGVIAGNPGYSAACNSGAKLTTGDTLLFLNADITVGTDTLERCASELASQSDIGIVTPRLVRPDGRLDHACHRGIPTSEASLAYKLRLHRVLPSSRRLARYTMAWLDPSTDHDVEACTGAFVMMRRDLLAAVGGWDERYRFYGEDVDLCIRVAERGFRVRYLGTAAATHLKGAMSHRDTPDRLLEPSELAVKRWVQREVIASHRLFFDEHLRSTTAPPLRWAAGLLLWYQTVRVEVSDRLGGARRR